MKEMRQNRKTRYTRMVLQDSLIELMKQKPISKITIKEICETADINRTTFYDHFTDQYELLRTIEDQTLSYAKERLQRLLETDKNAAQKIIESIFEYFVENSNHIQVLMSEQGDVAFQKKLLKLIYEYCRSIPADAKLKDTKSADVINDEYFFVFAVNGSVGIIQHWLKTGLQKSAKEMAEILCSIVFI
ncbi:TetR family transcriptional regulator [Ruminiclostridium sufflavum DSM 19573]|uniref:TetR family transcriptional regulator n=2 Tax=Ruminiclostridium TaxID=1508657 RepID=A0A318XHY7_9FIRM|nr:TetR family transcriptional regulator [Ruminiclostridium sufflavum DSM 19573]